MRKEVEQLKAAARALRALCWDHCEAPAAFSQ